MYLFLWGRPSSRTALNTRLTHLFFILRSFKTCLEFTEMVFSLVFPKCTSVSEGSEHGFIVIPRSDVDFGWPCHDRVSCTSTTSFWWRVVVDFSWTAGAAVLTAYIDRCHLVSTVIMITLWLDDWQKILCEEYVKVQTCFDLEKFSIQKLRKEETIILIQGLGFLSLEGQHDAKWLDESYYSNYQLQLVVQRTKIARGREWIHLERTILKRSPI